MDARNSVPGLTAQWASPKHDSQWCCAAFGFSLNVIPAKGEARVSGLAQRGAEGMVGLGAGQWNARGGGNA